MTNYGERYDLDPEEEYGEPVILTDRETGEPFVINPGGYKVWVVAPKDNPIIREDGGLIA